MQFKESISLCENFMYAIFGNSFPLETWQNTSIVFRTNKHNNFMSVIIEVRGGNIS